MAGTEGVSVGVSEASAQQEHEENGAEQDAERTDGGNHDLRHHLHVADQRI